MPIAGLTCPSHKVDAVYAGASRVNVSLGKSETHGGNRDYILRYRLDGDRIQSGLLLTQGEKENFFVLMMQPPKRTAAAEMPGREYVFIVDVSGSMYGFPLSISKKLLADLIGRLRPTDRFNVLLFSGGSSLMAEESLPATADNIQRAISVIERQRGGGGTELLPALKRALSLKREEGFSRSLVVVTDGFVAVEEDAFDLIRKNLGDANLFAFGIGSSVNRHLIEGMAHVGMGEPFIITKPDAAATQAERFRKMIESPVLTRVKVAFKGFKAYDVEPLSVPDVLAERPVLVFGKWRGALKGTVALSGLTGKGPYAQTINVENYKADKGNEALKYLWARHRITILSDYNKLRTDEKRVKEITDLGLAYNLLTAYTSFVAVDHEVRNVDGKWTTVEQPLPLPEGVSDYAVGGRGHYAAAPAMQMSRTMTGGAKKMESRPAADGLADKEQPALEKKDKVQAVRVVDVKTEKGLTREDVLKAVQSSLKAVEKCLAAGRFSGAVRVHLTVHPDGALKNVAIDPADIKDAKMRQCLIDAIKHWHFPKTAGGGAVNVVVTLQI
jgi:Ca-activated chloride channel family protein